MARGSFGAECLRHRAEVDSHHAIDSSDPSGTWQVHIEMDSSAEIWAQVYDGVPAVWRVYRDDNNVLCRVIILTVHTPRNETLQVSSTVGGIKPSIICTPGWVPPSGERTKKNSSEPLVAENGLSLTTLLRMAARAGATPTGFEPRDYTKKVRVRIQEPSLKGEIWAKEKGGIKIKWSSSGGIASFIKGDGLHKVYSIEVMLLRDGEECYTIAQEIPNAGYYCWKVSNKVKQSDKYKDGVWLRGGAEIISDFEQRLDRQRSLRDSKGHILKKHEIEEFLKPEYQIRVRVKSLHNGEIPLMAHGPDFIEDISKKFFIVRSRVQLETQWRAPPTSAIRLLFPRGKDLVWTVGTAQTIKWQTQGCVDRVCVSLVSHGVDVSIIAENSLNVGVIIHKMPRNMQVGDAYRVRVRSKQDASVVTESVTFRVVDGGLGAALSTFTVTDGVGTALSNNTKPVTTQVRNKMLKTRKAFGEESCHAGELPPLDLELRRTDGTLLLQVPSFVQDSMKHQWDAGRGPQNLNSSFLHRPEIKTAHDKDLFRVFRPRTGPDVLDAWSKAQEVMYNKWRQQKIQRVMAESGIEGEIRDWKDLMDEWETKNNPNVAKMIAKEKEQAEHQLAASQSLDLWELMRLRYKRDKIQVPITPSHTRFFHTHLSYPLTHLHSLTRARSRLHLRPLFRSLVSIVCLHKHTHTHTQTHMARHVVMFEGVATSEMEHDWVASSSVF